MTPNVASAEELLTESQAVRRIPGRDAEVRELEGWPLCEPFPCIPNSPPQTPETKRMRKYLHSDVDA